jgi:diguanylate cyclase (GGDEF)-like protein/PAS domain S-box-containing protein
MARRLERERAARKLAENLFEHRSQELYDTTLALKQLAETLQQSQRRLQRIASHAPVGIAEVDRNLICTYANSRYAAIYGRSSSEVVGKPLQEILGPSQFDAKLRLIHMALDGKAIQGEVLLHSVMDGSRHFSVAYQPEFSDDGGVTGFVSVLSDITERKKAEDQLHHLNENLEAEVETRTALIIEQNQALKEQQMELLMAKSVFDNSAEAVVVTNPNGDIILTNPAFSAITGYSAEEALGKNMRLLQSNFQNKAFYEALWATLSTEGRWQGEIVNRRKNGENYPEWLTISSVKDESGTILNFVATFSDISTLKKAQEQVEFLAYHDPLTRLPNRLLGRERLQQALIYAHHHQIKIAVYCLDIDNFKLINDGHGHSVGDQVLQHVVSRLQPCLGEGDTLCRLAGDEFLIVRTEAQDQAALVEFGDSLINALSEPIRVDKGLMETGISIGISVYPEDGTDAECLIRNADTALYAAKNSGRRQHQFFNAQMNANLIHYLEVRSGLRQALERKEFILHYQPKLDLANQRVTGTEALIRWAHPQLGLTYPDYFIGIAEESELIIDIGDWVIREACRQAADWQRQGWDFGTMAVNVSAVQFKRGNLGELIEKQLQDSGLPPAKLELELTESVLMEDIPKIAETITRLRTLGIAISLDDFGTGYSSLSYLKRFKPDKLKIDKSFIRDIASDQENQSLIRNIILIGKNLNLTTIAEGVETPDELEELRNLGCDEIQGYLISKPLPPDAFEAFHKGLNENPGPQVSARQDGQRAMMEQTLSLRSR